MFGCFPSNRTLSCTPSTAGGLVGVADGGVGGPIMNHRDISQQIWVEHALLKHLLEGMRAALDWKLHGEQIARKLSTLLFISQCLHRHLERLMSLEEQGGYMDLVLET